MALYAFDGTGDRWNPGTRWNLKDLRKLNDVQKDKLLDTITPEVKTDKGRYLTNVVFIYKEYVRAGGHAEYFPGVGSGAWFETQTGKTLDFIFGGAFGIGALGIVNQAFDRLKKNFKEGDYDIDIIGYSRGAAIARMFADKVFKDYSHLVGKKGKPLSNKKAQPIIDKDGKLKPPLPIIDENGKLNTAPPIRFVGLFDTVASFGSPFDENELSFQHVLPRTVDNAFHAMSVDLRRLGFGLDRAYGENVLEVWFRGGHGDIGGNSPMPPTKPPTNAMPNRGRTNITLSFMLKKAKASGIGLNFDVLDYPTNIKAPISVDDNILDKLVQKDSSRIERKYDVFHHSFFDENGQEVKLKGGKNSNPPLDRNTLVIEEEINESEISDQRLLQLTPDLAKKFPNNQSIYDLLHKS